MKLDGGENKKRKLSKRKDPEASVSFYSKAGFPVQSVLEYLMTIANSNYEEWRMKNPDADMSEFKFKLEKMPVSGALFDMDKLASVSRDVISKMSEETLFDEISVWAKDNDEKLNAYITASPDKFRESIKLWKYNGKKVRKDIAKWSDLSEMFPYLYGDGVDGYEFDEKLTADMRAALYAKYGLDQPIYIQFFRYVGNMLRGDLGVSYNISKNTPISQLIQSRLPISIQIGGMAVTLGALVGLVLGIIAALKRDTIFDTIATIISVIGVSVPSYVFALALSYTFGFKLRWFPMLFSAKDVFGSSVLPSVSLSMFTMASIARFTRSEMIEVLDSDYMLLAESKGISGPALIFRHALRNALIPIITVLAPLIVDLMTGSLVVEKIFAIPGVGSLLVTAIQSNDYNVVIGLSFIYSAMYIGIMLVVDLLYGIIDPRIRLAKGDD